MLFLLPVRALQVTAMLGLAASSAGKRAKGAAATAAPGAGAGGGTGNGNTVGAGGRGPKDEAQNDDVFRRWCGRLLKALGKCFTAPA